MSVTEKFSYHKTLVILVQVRLNKQNLSVLNSFKVTWSHFKSVNIESGFIRKPEIH